MVIGFHTIVEVHLIFVLSTMPFEGRMLETAPEMEHFWRIRLRKEREGNVAYLTKLSWVFLTVN